MAAASTAALILVLWLSRVFSGEPAKDKKKKSLPADANVPPVVQVVADASTQAEAALQHGAPSEEGGADITITPDGCVKPSVEDDPFGLWDMISGADPEKDCRIT